MSKQITIKIEKLIEVLKIGNHYSSADDTNSLRKKVEEALIAAVRDAEVGYNSMNEDTKTAAKKDTWTVDVSVQDNTTELERLLQNYIIAKKALEDFKVLTEVTFSNLKNK